MLTMTTEPSIDTSHNPFENPATQFKVYYLPNKNVNMQWEMFQAFYAQQAVNLCRQKNRNCIVTHVYRVEHCRGEWS